MKQVLQKTAALAARIAKVAPQVIADVAKLKDKRLAAAVVGLALAALSPFGVNVGPSGDAIIGGVVLVGTIAALLEQAAGKSKATGLPVTLPAVLPVPGVTPGHPVDAISGTPLELTDEQHATLAKAQLDPPQIH